MSPVFDEMVPVDIASLNVTATVVAGELKVELSSGLTEESVGAVVSVLTVKSRPGCSNSSLAQEITNKLKRNIRIM